MAVNGEAFPLQSAPGPQRRQIVADQIDLADRRMVEFERARMRVERDVVAVERGLKRAIQHQFLRCADPDRSAWLEQPELVGAAQGQIQVVGGQQSKIYMAKAA